MQKVTSRHLHCARLAEDAGHSQDARKDVIMTRDRNRKKAIRARAQHDNVPYNVAKRRIGGALADHGHHDMRWSRAAAALRTNQAGLPAALIAFAGLPPVSGPLGQKLVRHTLDTLQTHVPVGAVLTTCDLFDATTSTGLRVTPPISPHIIAAHSEISQTLESLSDRELRSAAVEFRMTSDTALHGIETTLIRRRRNISAAAELEDTGYPDVDDGPSDDDYAALTTLASATLNTLTGPTARWDDTTIEALRCAIAVHLAQIGDAFLHTSEYTALVLDWHQETDNQWQATHTIPGAPTPLRAIVTTEAASGQWQLFGPSGTPALEQVTARGHVGTGDPTDSFDTFYSTDTAFPSLAAAQFAAASFVTGASHNPHQLRSSTTNRLLIPRTELLADEATIAVDLYAVLQTVSAQHEFDPNEILTWATGPHIDPDSDDVGTIIGLVLDNWGCPVPRTIDEGSHAPLNEQPFEDFLISHAIRLTDLARTYLTGQQDAGQEPLLLRTRHDAGMHAILKHATTRQIFAELSGDKHVDETTLLSGANILADLVDLTRVDEILTEYFD
ncbi:hypothetical protein QN239_32955 [Mycolicibacterium sp. Y3]